MLFLVFSSRKAEICFVLHSANTNAPQWLETSKYATCNSHHSSHFAYLPAHTGISTQEHTVMDIKIHSPVSLKKHWASVLKSLSCTHTRIYTPDMLLFQINTFDPAASGPMNWNWCHICDAGFWWGHFISSIQCTILILRACELYASLKFEIILRPRISPLPLKPTSSNHAEITRRISFYTNLWSTSAHAPTDRNTKKGREEEKMRHEEERRRTNISSNKAKLHSLKIQWSSLYSPLPNQLRQESLWHYNKAAFSSSLLNPPRVLLCNNHSLISSDGLFQFHWILFCRWFSKRAKINHVISWLIFSQNLIFFFLAQLHRNASVQAGPQTQTAKA